jgi:hypothetical protein
VALATAEAIRDRIYTLIEALTPASLSADKFRRYRNELGADFEEWAEANVPGAFRRFQVREVSVTPPDVSNTTWEAVDVTFRIAIAYPQTNRYGAANAMDRDDVRNQDWLKINKAIGVYGRANFTTSTDGSYDATPLGAEDSRESGGEIDYLVVTARFRFNRSIT